VITEPFQAIVASGAARLGVPGYHFLAVAHPVWGKDEEQLRELVRPIVPAALAQLSAVSG
jgi:hypothetical protein